MIKGFFIRDYIFIFVVILLSVVAGLALLHPGFPPTHDGEYHIIRFWQFYKVLTQGELYPRWAPDLNNGYGIPLFTFVYPFPNYFASLLHFFHVSFIDAFKLSMFLASVLGGMFFYLWSKEFWGSKGGLVSSVFYTFSPYHFLDIYIRGSVGEVWALGLIPLFLWAITKHVKKENYYYFFLAVIGLSLTIFSHNILGLMLFCFAVVYGFYLVQNGNMNIKKIISLLTIFFLSLSMTAIFWLPALLEKKYTVGLQVFDIASNFPEVYQLIFPSWGTGFSSSDLQNQMSPQIGVANLLVVFYCIVYAVVMRRKKYIGKNILYFFLAIFIILIFFMLKFSLPLWEHLPLLSYFQFPWRLLSLTILCSSFLAGFIVREGTFSYGQKKQIIFTVVLISLAVLLGKDYAKPDHYHMRNDNYYLTRSNFTDGTNSPGNAFNTKWMQANLEKTREKITLKPSSPYRESTRLSTKYEYELKLGKKTNVLAHIAYFPGWKVFSNGTQVPTKIDEAGVFSFVLPPGTQKVSITYRQTFIQQLGFALSFLSLCVLVAMFFKSKFVTIKKR